MSDSTQLHQEPDGFMLPASMAEAITSSRLSHAVLLVGTEQATQRAARYTAQALLCTGAVRPCGKCGACVQFEAGAQADFFEVGGTSIKTADVEALQSWLTVRGHHGQKVYAMYGVGSMTGVAANRILKTLEEPEPGVYALLTAVSRQSVLSTILSRCFTYAIASDPQWAQSDPQVVPILERLLVTPENDSFDGFIDKMIKWTEMWAIERQPALVLASTWQSYCGELPSEESLALLVEWFRDMLHIRVGHSDIRFRHWETQATRIAPILEVKQWTRAIEIVMDSRQRFKSHVVSLLNFEQMCIRLREVLT